LYSCM